MAVSSISDLAHVELGVATAVVGPLIIVSLIDLYAVVKFTPRTFYVVGRFKRAPFVVRHFLTCRHPLESAVVPVPLAG